MGLGSAINAEGPERLIDIKPPDSRPLLDAEQRWALARIVEDGPVPAAHRRRRYWDCWRIEAVFRRLKDFRRIATRYDKLAANFCPLSRSPPSSHSGYE